MKYLLASMLLILIICWAACARDDVPTEGSRNGISDKPPIATASVDVFGASTGFKPQSVSKGEESVAKDGLESLQPEMILLWPKTEENLSGVDKNVKHGVLANSVKDVIMGADMGYVVLEHGVVAVSTSDGSVMWSNLGDDGDVKGLGNLEAVAVSQDGVYVFSPRTNSGTYVDKLNVNTGALTQRSSLCNVNGVTRAIVDRVERQGRHILEIYVATNSGEIIGVEFPRYAELAGENQESSCSGRVLWRVTTLGESPITGMYIIPGMDRLVYFTPSHSGIIRLNR